MGCKLKCSSRRKSASKISMSMRSDCASMPARGSRFVGLLSMIITKAPGSGRRAHPESNNASKSAARQRGRSMPSIKTWKMEKQSASTAGSIQTNRRYCRVSALGRNRIELKMHQGFSNRNLDRLAVPFYLAHEHGALDCSDAKGSQMLFVGVLREASFGFLPDEECR